MNKTQVRINDAAARLIEAHGLINLTRKAVCEQAGIPEGSFTFAMGVQFTQFVAGFKEAEAEGPTSVSNSRTAPALRKKHILAAALVVARDHGYGVMNRAQVSEQAGCSPSLVSRYFPTFQELRVAVVAHAIEIDDGVVMAQAILANDPQSAKISGRQRDIAALSVSGR